jgi:hypothetical protein
LSLHSEVLGLDLHLFPSLGFRFFDPISNEILRSYAEAEFERVFEQNARSQAELARSQAELERSFERQARLEAEAARQQAEAIAQQERLIALQERNKNEKLAAYLRSLGINPDEIS